MNKFIPVVLAATILLGGAKICGNCTKECPNNNPKQCEKKNCHQCEECIEDCQEYKVQKQCRRNCHH